VFKQLFSSNILNVALLWILLSGFYSCRNPTEVSTVGIQYFDLKVFFEQETESLKQTNPKIHKTVLLNGKRETAEMYIDDWKKELMTFAEADINKAAFIGKYDVDTIFSAFYLPVKITYKALDENLKTRFLEIVYDEATQNPQKISVSLFAKNTLYYSEQHLEYERGVQYSVSGKQEIRFLSPDDLRVVVMCN